MIILSISSDMYLKFNKVYKDQFISYGDFCESIYFMTQFVHLIARFE